MLEKLEKGFAILTHPLPTLFLLFYGEDEKAEILKDPKTFFQFYRSNRLRGFKVKESVKRALKGYGCYKGFRAEPIYEFGFLSYIAKRLI